MVRAMTTFSAEALADLQRSGITDNDAAFAGMHSTRDASTAGDFAKNVSALIIPYYDALTGAPVIYSSHDACGNFFRLRYYSAPHLPRYTQPKKSGTHAYFPRVKDWTWREVAKDQSIPVIITEGEKKALAACLQGLPTIGLGGVHNYQSSGQILPEIVALGLQGRTIYVIYDSDAATNPHVLAAEGRLMRELIFDHKADVKIVRLPPAASGEKQGIDDYLVAEGVAALEALMNAAQSATAVEREVLKLNDKICWLDAEGRVYEDATGTLLDKGSFCDGSIYGTIRIPSVDKKNNIVLVPAARHWLTHPHARRYTRLGFSPQNNAEFVEDGARVLNTWKPAKSSPGDVRPFLELHKHIVSDIDDEQADFSIKLMAYKAQNISVKIPLALVLVGLQGSGKSMYASAYERAFAPNSRNVDSLVLRSPFNGWLEKALIAVVNEAKPDDVAAASSQLKMYISEQTFLFNEKYRAAYSAKNYATFILTSNDLGVASYDDTDRRMFVIETNTKKPPEFYADVSKWLNGTGPEHLMHYLENYDLQGWTPPAQAPLTGAKRMAYEETRTPVERVAQDMRTSTEHTIKLWIDSAIAWASLEELAQDKRAANNAKEVVQALSTIQMRPWYTADELSMMFPQLIAQTQGGYRMKQMRGGELSRALRTAGVPFLRNADNPAGFIHNGRVQNYLIVHNFDKWRTPISQEKFTAYMSAFPSYANYIRGAK